MSSFKVSKGSGTPSIDPGTYPARCYRIIDIGTQHSEYQGRAIIKRQMIVQWELPTELIEEGDYEGQPKSVGKFYTHSLHEKSNLRHDLENWRGKAFTAEELDGFDMENILGATCLVTVSHTESGNTKVSAVTALPKGMDVAGAVNDTELFYINDWDDDKFNALSEGIQKIIMKSDEYKAMNHSFNVNAHNDVDNERPVNDEYPHGGSPPAESYEDEAAAVNDPQGLPF